jgi:hypothetical protein
MRKHGESRIEAGSRLKRIVPESSSSVKCHISSSGAYFCAFFFQKTPEVTLSTDKDRSNETTSTAKAGLKLEAVVIPVADADRAMQFYEKLGWRLDAGFPFDNGFRVVQFTPPGSGCSVQFGAKITSAAPGSAQGLYLIVSDIEAARNEKLGLLSSLAMRHSAHREEPNRKMA